MSINYINYCTVFYDGQMVPSAFTVDNFVERLTLYVSFVM